MRIVEATGSFEKPDTVALQLCLDDVALATNDVLASKQEVVCSDVVLTPIGATIHLPLP